MARWTLRHRRKIKRAVLICVTLCILMSFKLPHLILSVVHGGSEPQDPGMKKPRNVPPHILRFQEEGEEPEFIKLHPETKSPEDPANKKEDEDVVAMNMKRNKHAVNDIPLLEPVKEDGKKNDEADANQEVADELAKNEDNVGTTLDEEVSPMPEPNAINEQPNSNEEDKKYEFKDIDDKKNESNEKDENKSPIAVSPQVIVEDNGKKDLVDNLQSMSLGNVKFQDLEKQDPIGKANDSPGAMGKPVVVKLEELAPLERNEFKEGWRRNNFNQFVSDKISVNRSLPDPRDDECKGINYKDNLPDTSIIICFIDEAWTTLIRTVHSVLNCSPDKLIREVLLVDDFSSYEHLKQPLEDYFAGYDKVKIIRTKRREGLVRARIFGYEHAVGDIITFLDSHCECTEGWLEPLLARVAEDRRYVVWPLIDEIEKTTFEFRYLKASSGIQVGHFNWNMEFRWMYMPDYISGQRNTSVDPVASPTMAGGLFSIDRLYFKEIGLYDIGMNIWGGENLEISFRIWMCGGRLEIIPCSHVGHVFRDNLPYKFTNDEVQANTARMVEVWLDDYKQYYYERGLKRSSLDVGDISERIELRKKLNCQTFDWYLKNVYPSVFLPQNAVKRGQIRNKGTKLCLDAQGRKSGKAVTIEPCSGKGATQLWYLTVNGEVRRDDMCLDNQGNTSKPLSFSTCHGSKGNQEWEVTKDSHLYNVAYEMCIETLDAEVVYRNCSSTDSQIWTWEPMVTV